MPEKSIIWDLISHDRSSATNDKVASSFDKLDRHTSNLGATFGRLAGAAKVMGAGLTTAAGFAVVGGIKTLASLQTTQTGFTTLLGSAKKANDYLAWMKAFAAATPFDLAGLTDSARLLIGVGVSAKQSKVILQDFGDTAGAVGMDAQHFSMAMLAVSQSISAGHIKLGDMNQLMNDGIPIWKLLSEALGKPVPQIQKMISKGQLLSKDVMPKLLAAMHKDYGGAMSRQSETLTGLWSTLMDTINIGMADALTPLLGMMTGGLKTGIKVFGDGLKKLPDIIKGVKKAVKGLHLDLGSIFGKAQDIEKAAQSWISPVISGLKTGIQHGQWSGFWPMIEQRIFSGAGKAGAGGTTLLAKLGQMTAGIDWMKIGMGVGAQAFPFAIGFVGSLTDGIVTAFRKHPWYTILGILSIIPIGRVAGLFGKALKPGLLKGVLDSLSWGGKKLEGPIWGFLKALGRGFASGFEKAAPEVTAGAKDLIETGILKVMYRAEGVSKAVGKIFTVIMEAPGKFVGKIVSLMVAAGKHIINGLISGMKGMLPALLGTVGSIAAAVPDKVKKLLHIFSPSRVMEVLGGHTMQGFVNGIRGKKKEIHSALEDVKSLLSKEITKWNGIYDAHKSKLADLRSAYKDLKSSIRDAFAGTSITDRGDTFASVAGSYSQDIAKSRASVAALARLKKMGLSTPLLTQLAQGGAGSLGLEQSIIASGKNGIATLNRDQAQLNKLGNAAGGSIANATYAKAIAAETKTTAALKKAVDDLKKSMDKVEHALRHPGHINAVSLRAALLKILRQADALAGKAK